MFPFFPFLKLIRSGFNAEKTITSVHIPKLFLHGTEDEVVPYRLGKKLFRAAPHPKQFYAIQGAGHNNTYLTGGQSYFDKIEKFVTETLLLRLQVKK